jgi:hypothetical protein
MSPPRLQPPQPRRLHCIFLSTKQQHPIFVSCPSGSAINIATNLNAHITDLKQKIQLKTKIPVASQVLIYQSKCLDDSFTIKRCGLSTMSSIAIRLRLLGGQITGTLEDWLYNLGGGHC